MSDIVHKSVLLEEVIEGLELRPGDTLVDGTFGGGGHSRALCERLERIEVIAIDQDKDALQRAQELFKGLDCKLHVHQGNFREIDSILPRFGKDKVDAVLLDLGFSSDQIETSGRGFSFLRDEPLLMTYKNHPKDRDLTAKDVVNTWSEEYLMTIIKGYGQERYARRIAGAIVKARESKEINTTFELVEIIKSAVPPRLGKKGIHPATRTFQAIRMAVNDELNTLDLGLKHGFEALKSSGRMAVISFHSLEDRIVKNFYKAKKNSGEAKIITKKPITATQKELEQNNRARSAKLRILEKI